MEKSTSCVNCNAKSYLFTYLTTQELEMMDKGRCQVKYNAGETIRKQGAHLSHVISVTSGLCKMYLEGVESRNIILRIIKPTSFIGGPGLYADFRHHFTVTALKDTTVCFIDSNIFKEVMLTNDEFAREFMQDMSKNMIAVYNRIISLTQKQMPGRIADALIYLSDEIFESRSFDMILNKQELADFTKMSKDSVSRRYIASLTQSGHGKVGFWSRSAYQQLIPRSSKICAIRATTARSSLA